MSSWSGTKSPWQWPLHTRGVSIACQLSQPRHACAADGKVRGEEAAVVLQRMTKGTQKGSPGKEAPQSTGEQEQQLGDGNEGFSGARAWLHVHGVSGVHWCTMCLVCWAPVDQI